MGEIIEKGVSVNIWVYAMVSLVNVRQSHIAAAIEKLPENHKTK